MSRLHEDHIGALPEPAGANLLVSAAEWAELSRPGPELRGFLPRHIQLPGLRWHHVSPDRAQDASLAPFTESLDVMGDGSLMLLPTPGHTAGSMSLLVRRGTRPPLLLVGDLTYGADIVQRGTVPRRGQPAPARPDHPQRPYPRRAPAGAWSCARARAREEVE